MRFRMATVEDVPEMTRMYCEYINEDPPFYPIPGDPDTLAREWATHQLTQLLTNQAGYFCIVGVVKSKMVDKVVIGGKPKAMMTVFLTTRPISFPKEIAFVEMLFVDKNHRNQGVTKKLSLIASRYALLRGAKVFETSWRQGSQVGDFWTKAGMRPYQVYGAWVLEDGSSRTDLPYADSLSDPAPTSTMPTEE